VTAADTTLIMKCNIDITAKTNNGTIYDSFVPSLNIPLRTNIIEINGNENLTQYESGVLEETQEIFQQTSIEQSIYWGLAAVVFLVVLAAFIMFTKSDKATISKTQKQAKKILKKYGEWIVETTSKPIDAANMISVKTMDDLVKISEELGKPIIHYNPENPNDEHHIFYVLDDPTVYEYILHSKKDQSDMECPICKAKITIEIPSDEDMEIICPKCGNKIFVSMEKPEEKGFAKSPTSHLIRTKSE